MDSTAFDILQAIGLGLAFGLRPALAPLVVALCALGNLGVDFEGTSFDFLENPIVVVVIAAVALGAIADSARGAANGKGLDSRLWLLVAVVFGALFGAGSVNEHSDSLAWLGGVVGGLSAVLAWAALTPLIAGAKQRLAGEAEAGLILPALVEVVAVVTAFLSLIVPPLAVVALIAVLVLLVRGRGKSGSSYAGLRTLTK
ncbi:MAG: hypothetical protein J7513_17830 [Solirubrobacteraceae bacterium]|nr:hypothetical protein [Solirubrobacteraceae bacterium]